MNRIPVMIPFFDEKEEEAAIKAIRSNWVAQGPKVEEFERKVALHEGVNYGIATTSCTTALHLAMVASGLKSGMDVLVPSFTFVATANSVVQSGAIPILVDIDMDTYNIDVSAVENKIMLDYYCDRNVLKNRKTGNVLWGMIPVHQFGLCANIFAINELARKFKLNVIEDAACALGAKIETIHQGGFGNVSCISFHPRKSITTGEGGMILTNDEEVACKAREMRSHGTTISAESRHENNGFLLPKFGSMGFNYRMTDIQGAIGIEQIKKLDYILKERRRKANIYNELLQRNVVELKVPYVPENFFHAYQSYVCMLQLSELNIDNVEEGGNFRNKLLNKLDNIGISTRQGTHAIHMLDCYVEKFGYEKEELPNSYACDKLSLTLPLYVQMKDEDQKYVVDMLKQCIKELKRQ